MTSEEETFNKLKEPAPEIDEYGTKFWHKNGHLHRENDLPAAIWADGSEEYFKNGVRIK